MIIYNLIGRYFLDAVDFSELSVKESWGDGFEDCSVCRFRLNGITYVATEDPDDGYRSSMRDLRQEPDAKMNNVFPAIEVVGYYRTEGNCGYEDDVIELIDIKTGEVVLEVGTESTDDYYPSYVASFHPENMITNK